MKGAHRFSCLAQEILAMTKAREHTCLQLYVAVTFIHAWQDPPAQVIDMYESAYKVGMESGDFENALLSEITSYGHAFVTGHSHGDLEMKYLSGLKKLRLYNIKSVYPFAEEFQLPLQYLRGTAEKDFDLTLLSDDRPTGTVDNVSEHFRLVLRYSGRLQLAVYFNEDDLALQSIQGLDLVIASSDISFYIQSVRLCFCSLGYSTLYRNRRKRSYLNKSKRCLRQLQRIRRIRGTVCWHRCMLMEAHLEAATGRESTSIPLAFDRAIKAASHGGYDHDAGLGSQLAAEYCLSVMQRLHKDSISFTTMDTLLRRYLQQARALYQSWGAIALVNHLEKKHRSFLSDAAINPKGANLDLDDRRAV